MAGNAGLVTTFTLALEGFFSDKLEAPLFRLGPESNLRLPYSALTSFSILSSGTLNLTSGILNECSLAGLA